MSKKKKSFWTYNRIFRITLAISIVFIFISIWLSIDVIRETGTWYLFNVDFTGKSDIISAYASLLSGVLFFLSILFLILDMINQRRKNQVEIRKEKKTKKRELKDRLKITSIFIEDIKKNILHQGNNLAEYYNKELADKTLMNQCYFVLNKSVSTLLELDTITTYNAFQKFKPGHDGWKKNFLNLNKMMHFYKDVFPHLQQNYQGHIQDKVALKTQIQQSIHQFLAHLSNLQNNLVAELRAEPNDNLKEIVDFFEGFLITYKEQISQDKELGDSDLTLYSQEYYQPFADKGVALIQKHNYFTQIISPLLQQMGSIIIDVQRLEAMAKNYANDLKKNTKAYFIEDSEQLKTLTKIKEDLDSVTK